MHNFSKCQGVMTKLRKAERQSGQRKLFPVRLADMETLRDRECCEADSGKDRSPVHQLPLFPSAASAVELREYFIPTSRTGRSTAPSRPPSPACSMTSAPGSGRGNGQTAKRADCECSPRRKRAERRRMERARLAGRSRSAAFPACRSAARPACPGGRFRGHCGKCQARSAAAPSGRLEARRSARLSPATPARCSRRARTRREW